MLYRVSTIINKQAKSNKPGYRFSQFGGAHVDKKIVAPTILDVYDDKQKLERQTIASSRISNRSDHKTDIVEEEKVEIISNN